ncbi:MAG: terpene cyclase/mutase family protein [Deltaproteobacteria bacterium]|nr:terpene cyclase/mutase family protein [Deltaproteobacteria bacterium]
MKIRNSSFTAIALLITTLILAVFIAPAAAKNDVHETINKAVGYILKAQGKDGGWPRVMESPVSEAETTSWAIHSLALCGLAKSDAVRNGISFLLTDQKNDGSWNNNSAHTAFAVITLAQLDTGKQSVSRAVAWLKQCQQSDGGFPRIKDQGPSLSHYTAIAVKAFLASGMKADDQPIKRALENLMTVRNKDGGWSIPKGGESLSVATSWVVNALCSAGLQSSDPIVMQGIDWMMRSKKDINGGFGMGPSGSADPEITAYVLLALTVAGKHTGSKSVDDALSYLCATQQPDGAYISDTPIQFNKIPKKNVQTTCFAVWALKQITLPPQSNNLQ